MNNSRLEKAKRFFKDGKTAEAIKWAILAGDSVAIKEGYDIVVGAYASGGIARIGGAPETHAQLFIEKYEYKHALTLLKFLLEHSPPQYKSIFETTLAAMPEAPCS